jgi:hypothetical protein
MLTGILNVKIEKTHLKQFTVPSTLLLRFLCSFPTYAQQTAVTRNIPASRAASRWKFWI